MLVFKTFSPQRTFLGRDDVVERVDSDAVRYALDPLGAFVFTGSGEAVRLVVALDHGSVCVGLAALDNTVLFAENFEAKCFPVFVRNCANLQQYDSLNTSRF